MIRVDGIRLTDTVFTGPTGFVLVVGQRAALLTFLIQNAGEWHTARDMASKTGVPVTHISALISSLREALVLIGAADVQIANERGRGYILRARPIQDAT